MDTETKTAKYGTYGEVQVLQQEGTLSQIRTSGDQEFWVKTEKLTWPTITHKPTPGKVAVISVEGHLAAAVAAALANQPFKVVALDIETRLEPTLVTFEKESSDYMHAVPDHGAALGTATAPARYAGLAENFPRDLFAWANVHCVAIKARVPVKAFGRFAFNLQDANGQEFTPLMDGFFEQGEKVKGISLTIYFDEAVPASLFSEIKGRQKSFGKTRDTERNSKLTKLIYCNELGWELLRAGRKLGKAGA